MPKILERAVKKLEAEGKPEASAYAIAAATLQRAGELKKGTTLLTAKGAKKK